MLAFYISLSGARHIFHFYATLACRCSRASEGAVRVATWNAQYRKLTSADEPGLIIVWQLQSDGTWVEEMINARGESTVADMRWRADGKEICIAYEDGVVVAGSEAGSRLWSRNVGVALRATEWSPDGQILLLVTQAGSISVHNRQGLKIGVVPLPAVADLTGRVDAGGGSGDDATAGGGSELLDAWHASGERLRAPTVSPVPIVSLEWYDSLEGVCRGHRCQFAS